MIQQTLFSFKIGTTKERLTAHGGLALMAEFNHGIGLRELVDKYLPQPRSNRGFKQSVFVDPLALMFESGGVSLEDIRELKYEVEFNGADRQQANTRSRCSGRLVKANGSRFVRATGVRWIG
jgi:hypothetical protein